MTFHDAVELFLELALEYLDISTRIREVRFMQYWDLINPILKDRGRSELAHKVSIDRLNDARVALKHHGTPPAKSAIEGFSASVTDFFETNTPTVFAAEFARISLIGLVEYERARIRLDQAEKLLREGKIHEALAEIAISFAQLIDDYEDRKKDEFGHSPFFQGYVSVPSLDSDFDEIEESLNEIADSIEDLQDAVKILSLGLDYRRFAKFRLLTPYVLRKSSKEKKKAYFIRRGWRSPIRRPSSEDVRFCIDFVIESAIVLQEFDFEVERLPREALFRSL